MKKSLTTVLFSAALVLPALAAESLTLPATQIYCDKKHDTTVVTDGNHELDWDTTTVASTLGSWMITLTFRELSSYSNSGSAAIQLNYEQGDGKDGLSIIVQDKTQNVHFGYGKQGVYSDSPTLACVQGHTYHLAYDAVTQTAYLADVSAQKPTYISYDLSDKEGLVTTLENGAVHSWTNQGYHEFIYGDVVDMTSIAGTPEFARTVGVPTSVPEPATATLSLLALAGLAALRRRK